MSRSLMNLPAPVTSNSDGPLTGQWFTRKVTGKWARTEYWLVGQRYYRYHYMCFNNGNPECSGRFGHLFIQGNLLSNKGQKMVKHGVQWVAVCNLCDGVPEFDPYKSKFICECGIQQITERKGKWYTCAECSRRFKSMEPEFLCPECHL